MRAGLLARPAGGLIVGGRPLRPYLSHGIVPGNSSSSNVRGQRGSYDSDNDGDEKVPRPVAVPYSYPQQLQHRSSTQAPASRSGGSSRIVSFLSAWDTLSARLPRSWSSHHSNNSDSTSELSAADDATCHPSRDSESNAATAADLALILSSSAQTKQQIRQQTTELILNALKLSVSWLSSLSNEQQPASSGPATAPILVATRLADLATCGFPIDHEVIAAAIVAEAADLDLLDARAVEAKLGPGVLALLRDIHRVRTLPSRVELLDDEAASGLRELCLSFYDVRAIVVEVVSRHIALTASADRLPAWERQIRALEGLQIYAPLGHGLGLSALCCEMEDRCFQELFPKSYACTASWLRTEALANTDTLQRCSMALEEALQAHPKFAELAGSVEIQWRTKSLFSTMRKLLAMDNFERGGRAREDLFDLLGLRIIVHPIPALAAADPEEAESRATQACMVIRDVAHALWPPLPGRGKDYITRAKPNGYQSLHTTVRVASVTVDVPFAPSGSRSAGAAGASSYHHQQPGQQGEVGFDNGLGAGSGSPEGAVAMEIQIRTAAMHAAAESGEAAHAAYKGGLDGRQARQLRAWTGALQATPSLLRGLRAREAGPPVQAAEGSNAQHWPGWHQAAHDMFRHLDRDGDGHLSQAELQMLVEELGIQEPVGGVHGSSAAEAADIMHAVQVHALQRQAYAEAQEAAHGPSSSNSGTGRAVGMVVGSGSVGSGLVTFEQFLEFHRQVSMLRALPRVDASTAELLREQEEKLHRKGGDAVKQRGEVASQGPASPSGSSSSGTEGDDALALQRPARPGSYAAAAEQLQQQLYRASESMDRGTEPSGRGSPGGISSSASSRALLVGVRAGQGRSGSGGMGQSGSMTSSRGYTRSGSWGQRRGRASALSCFAESPSNGSPVDSYLAAAAAAGEAAQADLLEQAGVVASFAAAATPGPLAAGILESDTDGEDDGERGFELVARVAPGGAPTASFPGSITAPQQSRRPAPHMLPDPTPPPLGRPGLSGPGVAVDRPLMPKPQGRDPSADTVAESAPPRERRGDASLQARLGHKEGPLKGLLRRFQRRQKKETLRLRLVPVDGNPYRLTDPDISLLAGPSAAAAADFAGGVDAVVLAAGDLDHATAAAAAGSAGAVAVASGAAAGPADGGIAVPRLGPFVIGAVANRDCDAMLDVPTVSGRHARLEIISNNERGKKCIVTDLGSTNGTWVNRSRLQAFRDAELAPGDVVSFGELGIAFRVTEVLVSKPAWSRGPQPASSSSSGEAAGSSPPDAQADVAGAAGAGASRAASRWGDGLGQAVGVMLRKLAARAPAAAASSDEAFAGWSSTHASFSSDSSVAGVGEHGRLGITWEVGTEGSAAAASSSGARGAQAEVALALEHARECLRNGDWRGAVLMLEGAVESAPGSGPLWGQLANTYRRAAKRNMLPDMVLGYGTARAAYRAAVQAYRREEAIVEGDSDKAEAQRGLVRAFRSWAKMEFDLGHLTSARRLFQRSLAVATHHPAGLEAAGGVKTLFVFAHKEWRSGNRSAAEQLVARALEASPQNVQSLGLAGMLSAESGRPANARLNFQRALAADPGHEVSLQAWGRLEAAQGDMPAARTLFGRALQLNPSNVYVLHAWAVAEAANRQHGAARRLFERATQAQPRSAHVWQAWGVMEAGLGDLAEARRLLGAARQLDGRNVAVLTALGRVERLSGNAAAARQLLEAAYDLFPKHLPTLYELVALETSREGDARRAGVLLREIKRLNPKGALKLGGAVAGRRNSLAKKRRAAVQAHAPTSASSGRGPSSADGPISVSSANGPISTSSANGSSSTSSAHGPISTSSANGKALDGISGASGSIGRSLEHEAPSGYGHGDAAGPSEEHTPQRVAQPAVEQAVIESVNA